VAKKRHGSSPVGPDDISPAPLSNIQLHWNRIPSAILAFRQDHGIVAANHIAHIVFGYDEASLPGKSIFDLMPRDGWSTDSAVIDAPGLATFLGNDAMGRTRKLKVEGRHADGSALHLHVFLSKVLEGDSVIPIAVVEDAIERADIERNIGQVTSMLNNVVDTFYRKIYDFSQADPAQQGRFDMVGRMQAYLLGASGPAEVRGKTDFNYFSRDHSMDALQDELRIIKFGLPLISKEEKLFDRQGHFLCYVTASKMAVWADDGTSIVGVSGFSRDITDTKRLQDELLETKLELERANKELGRLATTDVLTGLYNRRFFEEFVKTEILKRANRFALLSFDVNRLKYINDTFGHAAGDEVIKSVARTLTSSVRVADRIARMGGDEFTILIMNIGEAVSKTAATIIRKLEQVLLPFTDERGQPFAITTGIGIVRHNTDPTDTDAIACNDYDKMLRMADIALYHAKRQSKLIGRSVYTIYEPQMTMPPR
jgi:diguanylate cyclase (GGDEF)-like protein/PAS domain S-box-containing protein